MAAPAVAASYSFAFRDVKGQTSRLRVTIGGATITAIDAFAAGSLGPHLAAVSNAAVRLVRDPVLSHTYGVNAVYEDIEDGALMTFTDPNGSLHRYKVPAPKAAIFLSDGETVDSAQADVAALLNDFTSNVYGRNTDVSPLVYVGGVRIRRKLHRRFTIWSRNPGLTGPGL